MGKQYRLIFLPDEQEHIVYLTLIEHREHVFEWQVQAVRYVREQGTITNKEYRELTGMSPRAALRELTDLCTREVLVKQGTTGRSTVYLLKKI